MLQKTLSRSLALHGEWFKSQPIFCRSSFNNSNGKYFSTLPHQTDVNEQAQHRLILEKNPSVPPNSVLHSDPCAILTCFPVNEGKDVVIRFGDGSIYKFKTAWLRDSHPLNAGCGDYNRQDPSAYFALDKLSVTKAAVEDPAGMFVKFDFSDTAQKSCADVSAPDCDRFYSKWLHAWAPFVGKSVADRAATADAATAGANVEVPPIKDTGSLLDDFYQQRTPWEASGFEVPVFDSSELRTNEETQLRFFETMVTTGTCMIDNLGAPASMEKSRVSEPLHELVYDVVGKMNQHNVRKNACGSISTNDCKSGMDYDLRKPLSMHTDHSPYAGTPGFLQFMYQAEGCVTSRLADGMAIAQYMKEAYPEDWELLRTVPITYSIRNTLYQPGGAKRNFEDPSQKPFSFELVHTAPVLRYDDDGNLVQVIQSETKRGNCAIPFDVMDKYLAARQRWMRLCEDDRFVCFYPWPEHTVLVTNNWRVLHGRALIAEGMKRTMVFGYTNKNLVDNRYRLLKQNQAERADPRLNSMLFARLPNQVLARLTN